MWKGGLQSHFHVQPNCSVEVGVLLHCRRSCDKNLIKMKQNVSYIIDEYFKFLDTTSSDLVRLPLLSYCHQTHRLFSVRNSINFDLTALPIKNIFKNIFLTLKRFDLFYSVLFCLFLSLFLSFYFMLYHFMLFPFSLV